MELRFHVALPTLDDRDEEHASEYVSTESEATKLLEYVDKNCDGSLSLIDGASLRGQIAIEMLSQCTDLAQHAIIDGSLCIPQPPMARACIAVIRAFCPLLFSNRACYLQI